MSRCPIFPAVFHVASGTPAVNGEELRASMHQLAVKDWYTDGHTNWDISQEFSNNLFMPDARSWKSRPGSTSSTSQNQPATAGALPQAMTATKESYAWQSPAAGPLLSSSSQAAALVRPQVTGSTSQAPVYSKPFLAAPVTEPSAGGSLLLPTATNTSTMLPRPLMRKS